MTEERILCLTDKKDLTAIADEIRELSGAASAMGLDAMVSNLDEANIEVSSQSELIASIVSALEGKAAGGETILQKKTVTPTTSTQTVKPDSGYDGLETVTVNAMPTAKQATPVIAVKNNGLITAMFTTVTGGYVEASTISATQQLIVQEAQTIMPSTSDQTINAKIYLTGAQTIKGDANLVPENIVAGKSIFGVNGTATTGGVSGVQTCTVHISSFNANINVVNYCTYENGAYNAHYEYPSPYAQDMILNNVVCGSLVYIGSTYSFCGWFITSGMYDYLHAGLSSCEFIPSVADSDVYVTLYDDD